MTSTVPRWSSDDWVELMLMLKKVPVGVRRIVQAAELGAKAPDGWAEDLAYLNRLCDAFGRAALVTVDQTGTASLNVDDVNWVIDVLDRYR